MGDSICSSGVAFKVSFSQFAQSCYGGLLLLIEGVVAWTRRGRHACHDGTILGSVHVDHKSIKGTIVPDTKKILA